MAYNEEHGIDPQSIRKAVTDILSMIRGPEEGAPVPGSDRRRRRPGEAERIKRDYEAMGAGELERLILTLEEEMHEAATDLRFEYAARLRDEINDLRRELKAVG